MISSEYNSHYQSYINLVGERSLLESLNIELDNIQSFFVKLPKEKLDYRYAPGKWTPKDILQHITDTERVFAYRAFYFSRCMTANLVGFDENMFAENAQAGKKTLSELLEEYVSVRNSTISLFKNFNNNQLISIGVANGNNLSVRAAGFIICGHGIHHCNIIKERYI